MALPASLSTCTVVGRKVVAGDIVDVKGWRHAKALARNRYIRLIEDGSAKAEVSEEKKESKPKAPKKKSAE